MAQTFAKKHVLPPLYVLTGCYFSGDGARRDLDGYYQITGRMDDVINVSGHRLGTAEIENVMVGYVTSYDAMGRSCDVI